MSASASPEKTRDDQRAATGRDVARLAGVSQAAVSLVLNGAAACHGLSEATQRRVRSAADKLSYVPNHAARSLRRKRTNTITFMTADLGNRYFAEVVTAAEALARARGYVVNVVAARTEADEIATIERLSNGVSDGLVVHGGARWTSDEILRLRRRGLACVLLQDSGAGENDAATIPCVRVDIELGGFLATRHLLELGHRRVAHITDERMAEQPINDRLAGYRRALSEADIEFDPALVMSGVNSFAGGDAAMRSLMADARPTAVFVFNDQMAIGCLHALSALGMRVPQDVAIVGFDGTELGAFSIPELTTIDHPRRELGRLAAQAMLDLLEGRGDPTGIPTLPVRLVVRRSCGGQPTI
ncbi:transcriptional regulator, LacI family [Rhizobiales bacterium GAS191]|nr:transcriptional regulator, LacI family [Rhizobiales bacterium GAS113]SEB92966.1 transcriptional regulator, LacI family [Rhizobiales bacterium GAS191]